VSQAYTLSAADGLARLGKMSTAHGEFETPAFMPVGTQGTVKGVTPTELRQLGAQIILSNTYHLELRPGSELIKKLGGLHKFMGWDGPILTDSGGYQVFSLAKLRKIREEGVEFQSHIDGDKKFFSPERVVEIQENLGVDILMVLDECLAHPATFEQARASLELTQRWAERSLRVPRAERSLLFGIVQGGMYPDLRAEAAERIAALNFDGNAIGGLSVGEPPDLMIELASISCAKLPSDRARYLMGVGTPVDIIRAVGVGVDMFDCVIPTRSARFGRLFTKYGHLNIRNQQHRDDDSPIEPDCDCYCCSNFSRAYLSHLTHAREILASELATIHNLRFYQRLMSGIRTAISSKSFSEFSRSFLERYRPEESDAREENTRSE